MANKDKKKPIASILGHVLDFLLIIVFILIVIATYYLFQIKILKNDYADVLGYTFFEVASGSMSNTIEIGDVIIVKVTKDVNKNDIIVYKEENNFITHRLIKKSEDKLIAKGDANNSQDKAITEEQVLGKVIYIIPKIGVWKKIILSPEIISLIVVLVILLGIMLNITGKEIE